MDEEFKIAVLSIVCGLLQLATLLVLGLIIYVRSTHPEFLSVLWAIFMLSGFATIVKWVINKNPTFFDAVVGGSGFGVMLMAFLELLPM